MNALEYVIHMGIMLEADNAFAHAKNLGACLILESKSHARKQVIWHVEGLHEAATPEPRVLKSSIGSLAHSIEASQVGIIEI